MKKCAMKDCTGKVNPSELWKMLCPSCEDKAIRYHMSWQTRHEQQKASNES